jgi:hypothetical protein
MNARALRMERVTPVPEQTTERLAHRVSVRETT